MSATAIFTSTVRRRRAGTRRASCAYGEAISGAVYDIVVSHGGSISAEHGIGQLKVDELAHYRSRIELDTMRSIKRALDPQNIMNPGKVIRV